MAKYITATPEIKEQLLAEISKSIDEQKFQDGVLRFSKTLTVSGRRAKIHFAEKAWLKMQALVMTNPDEVAWHGLARKSNETDDYYIDDIIVYPQEVSGVYVDTDQAEYTQWLMDLNDDVFNRVRMQGHSHVNMGVSPSQTDNDLYSKILAQLPDNTFYIFIIWNKRKERYVRVYDMEKNILFETNDCDILIGTEIGVTGFLKDAEKKVRKRVYKQQQTDITPFDDDMGYKYPKYSGKKKWSGKTK